MLFRSVQAARDAQAEAKEQFRTVLEQFSELVQLRPSDLEAQYRELNSGYERCNRRAEQVHQRIASVESVSEALFREWQTELDQYSSPSLRQDSERKLASTRHEYEQLIAAMKRASGKIHPVLSVFHDQVLYLKHNLNAQAIASLQGELVTLEHNVDQLVREMEDAIREADRFIAKLRKD